MAESTTHDTAPEISDGSTPVLDDDTWMRGLITTHASLVRKIAASQVGPDAADDVVSETFSAAWRNRAGYDPKVATERAWLVGIALNRCRELARAQRRWYRRAERMAPAQVAPDFADDAAARVDDHREGRAVIRALRELPSDQRNVLLLVARAGFAPHEIAAAMSVPAATVRSHLARARKSIANNLDLEDHTDA